MDEKCTRRSLIRSAGAFGFLTELYTFLKPVKTSADEKIKKPKAFALIGDRWHNSAFIRTMLGKTLGEIAGLEIDFTDEVTLLNTENLRNYRILVIYRDGGIYPGGFIGPYSTPVPENIISVPPIEEIRDEPVYWMSSEQGKAVSDFVKRGGGAFFYHNTGNIALNNKEFLDVIGGVYAGHPGVRPYKVKILNRSHPITEGVEDFVVTDQQQYLKYEKDPKFVFMESVNEDGLEFKDMGTKSEAGWAYDYGKGRVCYMSPGHLITACWNPEYIKLQKNAVKWLLKEK